MNLFESAVEFAVFAHAGQIDQDGMPHIFHCFEVFRRVQEMLEESKLRGTSPITKYTDEEILVAALLHDTVEDSPATLDQIEQEFGKNVREIVDSVSRRGTGDDKEFYRDFIYRAKGNGGGRILKVGDLLHNLSRAPKIKKASWRNKLEYKYGIALNVLNQADEPTWERASASVSYDENPERTAHFFYADPNGKKIEVTEAEYKAVFSLV